MVLMRWPLQPTVTSQSRSYLHKLVLSWSFQPQRQWPFPSVCYSFYLSLCIYHAHSRLYLFGLYLYDQHILVPVSVSFYSPSLKQCCFVLNVATHSSFRFSTCLRHHCLALQLVPVSQAFLRVHAGSSQVFVSRCAGDYLKCRASCVVACMRLDAIWYLFDIGCSFSQFILLLLSFRLRSCT
jgi:hypothetical protein